MSTDKQTPETHEDDSVLFKKEDNSSTVTLLVAIVAVLCIVSIVFYKTAVDVKQIKANVHAFSQELKAHYAKQGMDVSLTYDSVDAEGGLFHKSIIVDAPLLSVAGNGTSYQITSPSVEVIPEDVTYQEVTLMMKSPVKIVENNGAGKITYNSNQPLPVTFVKNNETLMSYNANLETGASITVVREEKTYDVTLNENAVIEGEFTRDAVDDYYVSVVAGKTGIVYQSLNTAIDALTYEFVSAPKEQEVVLHVENVTTDLLPAALAPNTIDITQRTAIHAEKETVELTIDQFEISGEPYAISSDGIVRIQQNELLPYIDVNVAIEGAGEILSALENDSVVNPDIRHVVAGALERIAPGWANSEAPVEFSISRKESQPFVIGNIKADELFANMLKEYYVKGKNDTSAENDGTVENNTVKESLDEPMMHGEPSKVNRQKESDSIDDSVKEPSTQEELSSEDKNKADEDDKTSNTEELKEVSEEASEAAQNVNDGADSLTDAVATQAEEAVESVEDAAIDAKDALVENTDAAKEEAEKLLESADEKVSGVVKKAKQSIADNVDDVKDATVSNSDEANEAVEPQAQ